MGTNLKPILFNLFLLLAFTQTTSAQAGTSRQKPAVNRILASNDTIAAKADVNEAALAPVVQIAKTAKLFNEETALANAEVNIHKATERRELMGHLKHVTSDDEAGYNTSHKKFLYGLANVFAKLKLYPLAMKCFLKTMEPNKRHLVDTLMPTHNAGYLAVNAVDDSIVSNHASLAKLPNYRKAKTGLPTTYTNIINTFNDGKKAAAYAMLFHVKQPVPGKRKVFVMSNTGHTFITLIKYNTDSTYASFSFGFYPKKRNPLSATPLVQKTSSVFKDDTYHQWDEVLGKFISKKRFEKILSLTADYDKLDYHLSNNNCTDFALDVAHIADIHIDETIGSWPLGRGNNPAITGQSIIEGKFTDVNKGKEGLFVNTVATVDK